MPTIDEGKEAKQVLTCISGGDINDPLSLEAILALYIELKLHLSSRFPSYFSPAGQSGFQGTKTKPTQSQGTG